LVPAVRGAGTLAALPMPLGSLIELLAPPPLAGPCGMPLTALVPAPAVPAFGVPAGLAVPTAGAVPVVPAVFRYPPSGAGSYIDRRSCQGMLVSPVREKTTCHDPSRTRQRVGRNQQPRSDMHNE
jgi:hypothetical protein